MPIRPPSRRRARTARPRQRQAAPARGDRAVWTGGDVDLFGTISPDGRHLTYVDWGLGNIMLRDLVAGTSRPLTSNGKGGYEHGSPHFSAISSDGRHVAYGWYQPGGAAAARAELRIAPLDEPSMSRTRTLWSANATAIRPFQWSHDNRQIAVLIEHADRTSQLGVLSLDGSSEARSPLSDGAAQTGLFSRRTAGISPTMRRPPAACVTTRSTSLPPTPARRRSSSRIRVPTPSWAGLLMGGICCSAAIGAVRSRCGLCPSATGGPMGPHSSSAPICRPPGRWE